VAFSPPSTRREMYMYLIKLTVRDLSGFDSSWPGGTRPVWMDGRGVVVGRRADLGPTHHIYSFIYLDHLKETNYLF
jgi:hypothetical protein